MAYKTHFASSSEPLRQGSTVFACCGTGILRAVFVATYEGDFPSDFRKLVEGIPNTIMFCTPCLKKLFIPSETEKARYFYALRSREEEEQVA